MRARLPACACYYTTWRWRSALPHLLPTSSGRMAISARWVAARGSKTLTDFSVSRYRHGCRMIEDNGIPLASSAGYALISSTSFYYALRAAFSATPMLHAAFRCLHGWRFGCTFALCWRRARAGCSGGATSTYLPLLPPCALLPFTTYHFTTYLPFYTAAACAASALRTA